MHRLFLSFVVLATLPASAYSDDASAIFQQRIASILQSHCTDCHGGSEPEAKLDLSGIPTLEQLRTQRHQWFKVLERVEAGSMPPDDADPLSSTDKDALLAWIRGEFTDILIDQQRQEGRSRFRRLSRNEYAYTIQDIFGIRPPVMRLMPGDGRVDGYDKVSQALPFSPAATEAQLKIAEETVERMFSHPRDTQTIRLWSRGSEQSKGHLLELEDNWNVSFNSDTHSGALRMAKPDGSPGGGFPGPRKPGIHRLRMHVYGYQTDKPLPVGIYAGHIWAYPQILNLVKVIDVPPGKPAVVETDVYLRTNRDNDIPGSGIRLIPLGLGVPVPKNTLASVRGKGRPGLAIQWVDLVELEESLPGQELLFDGLPQELQSSFQFGKTLQTSELPRAEVEAAMTKAFARIGGRLYRRDLTEDELAAVVASYMRAIDDGATLKDPFVTEVVALMTAPDFLSVLEKPGPLTNFALASRLAYFLWNSTPDEELLDVARQGKLTDAEVLKSQTERMLNDPKSDRFVEDFLDQWLGLWGIDNTTPDKDLYPEYDDELKIASVMESQATFRRMLDQNLSARDFVAPKWAMINSRLATVYDIPNVEGFQIRQVALPDDTPFGGIWTHASTMKVTANGTLTSPVKRGVWVAERLLGNKIPPPPANISPVDPDTRGAKTLREQLALHSSQGSCQACHVKFDAYGFALESFDVMGNFRRNYRVSGDEKENGGQKWTDGLPVDCSGVTPHGDRFANVRELRQLLADRPEQLAQGVTRHLITYATGEPASPIDQRAIESIVKGAARDDYGLRSLIHGVVQSQLFRSK